MFVMDHTGSIINLAAYGMITVRNNKKGDVWEVVALAAGEPEHSPNAALLFLSYEQEPAWEHLRKLVTALNVRYQHDL